MTRRLEHTSLLDECNYQALCPFNCPLPVCVKEYPGGAEGFQKDALIKALLLEGKTIGKIAQLLNMSVSAVERRYNNADFNNIDPAKAVPTNRPEPSRRKRSSQPISLP